MPSIKDIKNIQVNGFQSQPLENGKYIPELKDEIKISDLVYTPDMLLRKVFKGSDEAYEKWLMDNKLHPIDRNFAEIKTKDTLFQKYSVYFKSLVEEAKKTVGANGFVDELGTVNTSTMNKEFDKLEVHTFDLSNFSDVEFKKITNEFKANFDTSSPISFFVANDVNKEIRIYSSAKSLYYSPKPFVYGKSKMKDADGKVVIDEETQKPVMIDNFRSFITYAPSGDNHENGGKHLRKGLNSKDINARSFNFNINTETRALHKAIYKALDLNAEEVQLSYTFGDWGKKLYFESEIFNKESSEAEVEARKIASDGSKQIKETAHKERQGSIKPNETVKVVEQREVIPKAIKELSLEELEIKVSDETLADETMADIVNEEEELSTKIPFVAKRTHRNSTKKIEDDSTVLNPEDNPLQAIKDKIRAKKLEWGVFAKERINEALNDSDKIMNQFWNFIDNGFTISMAVKKIADERNDGNKYISEIIDATVLGELQLLSEKNKTLESLADSVKTLKNDKAIVLSEKADLENNISDLKQNINELKTQHKTALEELDEMIDELKKSHSLEIVSVQEKLETLLKDREKLVEANNELAEYKKNADILLNKYESQLQSKTKQIGTLEETIGSLESDVNLLKKEKANSEVEIKGYQKQIEQLKEENTLVYKSKELLSANNQKLEEQLKELTENRKLLEAKNAEQVKKNDALTAERDLLKKELELRKDVQKLNSELTENQNANENTIAEQAKEIEFLKKQLKEKEDKSSKTLKAESKESGIEKTQEAKTDTEAKNALAVQKILEKAEPKNEIQKGLYFFLKSHQIDFKVLKGLKDNQDNQSISELNKIEEILKSHIEKGSIVVEKGTSLYKLNPENKDKSLIDLYEAFKDFSEQQENQKEETATEAKKEPFKAVRKKR